jgi:hypothetical protein
VRELRSGDIIIIPPDVFPGWTRITDRVDHPSVRADSDRVLPAGYVNPAIASNLIARKTKPHRMRCAVPSDILY